MNKHYLQRIGEEPKAYTTEELDTEDYCIILKGIYDDCLFVGILHQGDELEIAYGIEYGSGASHVFFPVSKLDDNSISIMSINKHQNKNKFQRVKMYKWDDNFVPTSLKSINFEADIVTVWVEQA